MSRRSARLRHDLWRDDRATGGPAMGHARFRDRRSDGRAVAHRTEHPQKSVERITGKEHQQETSARIARSVNGAADFRIFATQVRRSAAGEKPLRLIRPE